MENGGIEERLQTMKDTVINTAQQVIGYRRGSRKEKWTSGRAWKTIDERRQLKAKREQALSTGKEAKDIVQAYKQKDMEVKRYCRADQKKWISDKLAEAEKASKRNDSKMLYSIVKDLSGTTAQRIPIGGTNGKHLKSQEEEAKPWKEHFQAVLYSPEPDEVHSFNSDSVNMLEVNTELITT